MAKRCQRGLYIRVRQQTNRNTNENDTALGLRFSNLAETTTDTFHAKVLVLFAKTLSSLYSRIESNHWTTNSTATWHCVWYADWRDLCGRSSWVVQKQEDDDNSVNGRPHQWTLIDDRSLHLQSGNWVPFSVVISWSTPFDRHCSTDLRGWLRPQRT